MRKTIVKYSIISIMKNTSLFLASWWLLLTVFSSCERIEQDVELPLPEVYLTSTRTDISQTKVLVKGERVYARKNGTDMFGVVYSDKTQPTITDNKMSVSDNDGAFDVTAQNLKANTTYYFRAYLQTKDNKIYYSNQLESSGLYDNRWERQEDIPETFNYFTGLLFLDVFDNLAIFNVEDNTVSILPYFTYSYNYSLGFTQNKSWFISSGFNGFSFGNLKILTGVREMIILNPNRSRIFIGGGFQVNNNLPSSKVFSNRLWCYSCLDKYGGELTVPMPTEGEAKAFSVGDNMFVMEAQTAGRLWDFTNLEWQPKSNHTFKNLGRIIAAGTSQRGYVISESNVQSIQGCLLYEYNPLNDTWISKKTFVGEERNEGLIFSVKNKIYYGLGRAKKTKRILKDIWEYDPPTDSWQQIGFYPGNGNIALIQTVSGNNVYLGMGYQSFVNGINGLEFSGVRDFWKFNP